MIVELKKGKKTIGQIETNTPLLGKAMHFVQVKIVVPIGYECFYDDGVEYRVRKFFDVSRKSKRQIALLLKFYGGVCS
jgi:hypothetical protein